MYSGFFAHKVWMHTDAQHLRTAGQKFGLNYSQYYKVTKKKDNTQNFFPSLFSFSPFSKNVRLSVCFLCRHWLDDSVSVPHSVSGVLPVHHQRQTATTSTRTLSLDSLASTALLFFSTLSHHFMISSLLVICLFCFSYTSSSHFWLFFFCCCLGRLACEERRSTRKTSPLCKREHFSMLLPILL